jgi:hypothetical protein
MPPLVLRYVVLTTLACASFRVRMTHSTSREIYPISLIAVLRASPYRILTGFTGYASATATCAMDSLTLRTIAHLLRL